MSDSYVQPEYEGRSALLELIARDDIAQLGPMIVAAALHEEDFDFALSACAQLSSHSDEIVRGNAVLGLGHLARLFGRLDEHAVQIVRDRLHDPSDYVRGQAYAAASDLSHFLGIEVRPAEDGQ